jgi:hypothetical protein
VPLPRPDPAGHHHTPVHHPPCAPATTLPREKHPLSARPMHA